jgi:hypothetical protein
MGIVAPQLEQNRALAGNPVPQRLQKTAILKLLHEQAQPFIEYGLDTPAVPLELSSVASQKFAS